jgi:hypothetical protein
LLTILGMARQLDPSTNRERRDGGRPFPSPVDRRGRRVMPSRYPNGDLDRVRDDATRPDDAISIDEVVERLSRDMSEAVNRAPFDDRDELRSYASALIREDTSAPRADLQRPTRRARLSFFAVAVWLAVAGAMLSFLVPAAGVVCFVMAGVAAVLALIVGTGEAVPEPTTDAPREPEPPRDHGLH